ncbi:MAG: type III-B CRISPR-associated protein Cas10/Cmr2 [Gloeobacterales cyanobacterium]
MYSKEQLVTVYHRKLFALLHDPILKALYKQKNLKGPWEKIGFLYENKDKLERWWEQYGGKTTDHIASASDRLALKNIHQNAVQIDEKTKVEVHHPLSGQKQELIIRNVSSQASVINIEKKAIPYDLLRVEEDIEKVFWWFWRFYPEAVAKETGIEEPAALLLPADTRIPDCPIHTHNSVVSALAGAMFPDNWEVGNTPKHPYLVLFTFSPVQEFIKSSRKFLDFWAGSYLLHYVSARLCWYIAEKYGPDAVVTPSLWSQEIVDAFLVKKYPEFEKYFPDGDPVTQFKDEQSNSKSLSTAGFPNIIVALAPGKEAAESLGRELTQELERLWMEIGKKVRDEIRSTVIQKLTTKKEAIWEAVAGDMPEEAKALHRKEFDKWTQKSNWEWNKLWDAQLSHTWERYWTAIPLGDPEQDLTIHKNDIQYQGWKKAQQDLSQSREPLPTQAEERVYPTLNVGTWWGSLQARLGQSIQAIKNTRTWQIPTAPGERSTVSGMYSALHPNLLYNGQFREGGGLPASSMNLFWRVMAQVYPGLFNGSEKLNALELTKRMGWQHGGIADSLGIETEANKGETDYESLIRFPNLSCIAAARFAYNYPEKVQRYWEILEQKIKAKLTNSHGQFKSLTDRPFQIPATDSKLPGKYNGVMFSSKWLTDDLGLQGEDINTLRALVEEAHKDKASGFGDGSPSDWWVLVLGDGDGMGQYVSGKKLKPYAEYLSDEVKTTLTERLRINDEAKKKLNKEYKPLLEITKRMGPSTHVGLNRALLDFSNRIVPYLTEQRFCGKVIYSGGDDVMAALPLEDLPEFLLSLQKAWCGEEDPKGEFRNEGGYWHPNSALSGLANRPHFTMGAGATMSLGIVIAHKSVPLPTVLESIWEAEKERAKKLPQKDGLCFRVIYGSGNTLEALMKGKLLEPWWKFMEQAVKQDLSPVLYRLAEELPRHAAVTENNHLLKQVAQVIWNRRDEKPDQSTQTALLNWLDGWEKWAWEVRSKSKSEEPPLGSTIEELVSLLRFSAFWLDKMNQRQKWVSSAPALQEVGS